MSTEPRWYRTEMQRQINLECIDDDELAEWSQQAKPPEELHAGMAEWQTR